jgi:hypothetical protein
MDTVYVVVHLVLALEILGTSKDGTVDSAHDMFCLDMTKQGPFVCKRMGSLAILPFAFEEGMNVANSSDKS